MKTKPKSKKAAAQARLNRAAVAWEKIEGTEGCEVKTCVTCKLLRAVRAFQKAGGK